MKEVDGREEHEVAEIGVLEVFEGVEIHFVHFGIDLGIGVY